MLSDQRSPYVGRFARGWHRLPRRCSPGNHRPRREPVPSIASRQPHPDRPRGNEQRDLVGADRLKSGRTRRGGRSRREDIVHEQHTSRCRCRTQRCETSQHRGPSSLAASSGLRPGVISGPPQHRADREVEIATDDQRERFRLIEAALGPPSPGQRHPRHRVCRSGRHLRHRRPERIRDPPPSGELQPVYRGSDRTFEQEGRPGADERRRRAIRTGRHLTRCRRSAAIAPRRCERHDLPDARGAERPRSGAAPSAPTREHDVEHTPEHPETLARGTDRCARPTPALTRCGEVRSAVPGPSRPRRATPGTRERPRAR